MDLTVLHRLTAAGLKIEAIDGRLKVSPSSRLTPEITQEIKAHKAEILTALTAPTPTFEADDSTWLRRTWCQRYRHPFGWRDVHGCEHCLTCVMPALSAPVAAILEVVGGEVVEHDPFCLPDDSDVMEFVGERAGIREHDGGFNRLEAERMAAVDWWITQATPTGKP